MPQHATRWDLSDMHPGKSALAQPTDEEVAEGFAIYFTTRLPNPKFTPELPATVMAIDFTATVAGLDEQLLGRLIRKEKDELESQRQQLLEQVQSYKRKIKQLEDDLLFRLPSSKANLLENTELIDILAVTKQTSQAASDGSKQDGDAGGADWAPLLP